MPKPDSSASIARSRYAQEALELLGHLIREARINRKDTAEEFAFRAGISRSLLRRIEKGDPGCSVGTVFAVAALCGIPLFMPEPKELARYWYFYRNKMVLLPKAVRGSYTKVHDDF